MERPCDLSGPPNFAELSAQPEYPKRLRYIGGLKAAVSSGLEHDCSREAIGLALVGVHRLRKGARGVWVAFQPVPRPVSHLVSEDRYGRKSAPGP